jgi:hypothetical protein
MDRVGSKWTVYDPRCPSMGQTDRVRNQRALERPARKGDQEPPQTQILVAHVRCNGVWSIIFTLKVLALRGIKVGHGLSNNFVHDRGGLGSAP